MAKWDVGKQSRGSSEKAPIVCGARLGTVDAATHAAAVTEAMRQFARLGLNARNIVVVPHTPEP